MKKLLKGIVMVLIMMVSLSAISCNSSKVADADSNWPAQMLTCSVAGETTCLGVTYVANADIPAQQKPTITIDAPASINEGISTNTLTLTVTDSDFPTQRLNCNVAGRTTCNTVTSK